MTIMAFNIFITFLDMVTTAPNTITIFRPSITAHNMTMSYIMTLTRNTRRFTISQPTDAHKADEVT